MEISVDLWAKTTCIFIHNIFLSTEQYEKISHAHATHDDDHVGTSCDQI